MVGIYEQQQMQLPGSISNYMAATKRNNIMTEPGWSIRRDARGPLHRCLLFLPHKF